MMFTSKSEHWLKTERVQFELPDGTLIPAQHAHAHLHTHPTAIHIHIKTRENADTRSTFTAHTTQQTNTVTWAHAQCARPIPNCPFFAIPSKDWVLKAPQLSLQQKNMASYLGIDFTRISTPSLRIGGASTLAAVGLTDNEMMRIGA